jgi:hypothetical protein
MAWCHPTHAQSTKCACGVVINLSGAVGDVVVICGCGRTHSKVTGSAFQPGFTVSRTDTGHDYTSTGRRRGGRAGCPGDPIV